MFGANKAIFIHIRKLPPYLQYNSNNSDKQLTFI